MRETRIIMGMPVTVHVVDADCTQHTLNTVFDYFLHIDETFSTFKDTSEITKINKGLLKEAQWSDEMKEVFLLSEKTKQETNGYFDIVNNKGRYDPSGLVKGWAILYAAQLLEAMKFKHFYVEAGGDIQVKGKNEKGEYWNVGIKNPFNQKEIVKKVSLKNNEGIATSGNYERGAHIYNPKNRKEELAEIISLTVIGPNIYEADRFATAAFAMQQKGIHFIEQLKGSAGYMINKEGIATMTTNFENYTK